MDQFKLIDDIKDKLIESLDIHKVILFGSFSHGSPNTESDIDLLVVLEDDSLPKL